MRQFYERKMYGKRHHATKFFIKPLISIFRQRTSSVWPLALVWFFRILGRSPFNSLAMTLQANTKCISSLNKAFTILFLSHSATTVLRCVWYFNSRTRRSKQLGSLLYDLPYTYLELQAPYKPIMKMLHVSDKCSSFIAPPWRDTVSYTHLTLPTSDLV